jgi:hypothetical protein
MGVVEGTNPELNAMRVVGLEGVLNDGVMELYAGDPHDLVEAGEVVLLAASVPVALPRDGSLSGAAVGWTSKCGHEQLVVEVGSM